MSKHVLNFNDLLVAAVLEERPDVVKLDVALNRKIATAEELETFKDWLLFILKPYNADHRPTDITVAGGAKLTVTSADVLTFKLKG